MEVEEEIAFNEVSTNAQGEEEGKVEASPLYDDDMIETYGLNDC